MNIVLLIDNLGSGGAQRQLVLLANEIAKKGVNVSLLYYGDNDHMLYFVKHSRVNVYKISGASSGSFIFRAYRILKAIKKLSPTSVISYLDTPNKLCSIYKFLNPKCIWVASERNLNRGVGWEVVWRKVVYVLADKVIPNSHAQSKWLSGNSIVPSSKLRVIWNGVSDELFLDGKEYRPMNGYSRFLSLGRLSYQKNPQLLISAVSMIKLGVLKNITFDWYGEEDPGAIGWRKILVTDAVKNNLPINFHPSVVNTADKLLNSSCLILTSRFEGTPNVILEAMAAGVFVIAPRIVDLPIILGRGERGILFDTGDAESLKNAIESYLNMTEVDKRAVVESARDFALNNFTACELANQYLSVLKS